MKMKTNNLQSQEIQPPCMIYPLIDGKQDIRDSVVDTLIFLRLVSQTGEMNLTNLLNQTNRIKSQIRIESMKR